MLCVEICQAARRVVGRGHVVELGRLRGRRAGEGDVALAADEGVDPERPGGIDVAEIEFFRRGGVGAERLKPHRSLRGVVAADEDRVAVGHPDDAGRCCGRLRFVAEAPSAAIACGGRWRDDDFGFVVGVGVARIPVGDFRAVGREEAEAFEFLVRRHLADRGGFDVEDLQRGLVGVAELRMLLAREEDRFSIGRPIDRRRGRTGWRAFRQAPRAGSEAARLATFGGDDPEVRWSYGAVREVIVVADLEGVVVLLDFLFIFGLVGGDEGDVLAVGAPCELLDAVGHVGEFARFAAGHRKDEELELRIFRGGVDALRTRGDRLPETSAASRRLCDRA